MTMEERIIQLRVGIVVVLAAVITGTLIFLFSDGWTSQYSLYMEPRTAPGVTRNTPVRKNGILIGRVGRVETTDTGVQLLLKINRNQRLYTDEVAQVGMESFLGDAVIEFVPGQSAQRGALLKDGDTITQTRVKPNPIEVVDIVIDLKERVAEAVDSVRRAGDTVDRAGQGFAKVTETVQEALGNQDSDIKIILDNMRNMTETADSALSSFNRVMQRFDEFISDSDFQGELKQTIKGLPQFFEEAKQTLAESRSAIDRFRQVGERADANLQNLEQFTQALGADGPEVVQKLKSSLDGLDRVVQSVDEFSRSIKDSDGSLGLLLKDPSLYRNLNATLANARDVSEKLKLIMGDLRIFADSVARDPGQLGVRGALQRRPSGAGYKGTMSAMPETPW